MTPDDNADIAIIKRIRQGSDRDEHEVAQHLLQSFRGMVYAIVMKPGYGNAQDVQDILHDAVSDLILYVRSDKFEANDAKLSTFFYAIARNKWLNVLRKRSKDITLDEIPDQMQSRSGQPEILEDLIRSEERLQVREALKNIDDSCFSILYKYWILDLKLKDIAKELDISEAVAKKRHERCRKKLKIYLKKDPRKK